jgi:two-component system NtrC family sensor kinase
MRDPQRVAKPEAWLLNSEIRRIVRERGLTLDVALRDAHGQAPSSIELSQLHDELVAYYASCERTKQLATLGSVAAGVTHEARNLLTGILGFAQVLLAKPHEPAAQRDILGAIEREARRCVDLLANCLQLSRAMSEPRSVLAITEIVKTVERLVTEPLRQRGCSLHVEVEANLAPTRGRAAELERVLINLILNAADAAGAQGQIEVRAQALGPKTIELSVTDNGPGVTEALQARIFERFFSTKHATGGTGLGLWLSRNIIEAHDGQLELDAAYAAGARFVIRLPALTGAIDG